MANFSVAARTLIHLGAELITSDEVALNELIKNAFDAESPRVRIDFHVSLGQTKLDEFLQVARGRPKDIKKADFRRSVADALRLFASSGGGDPERARQLRAALKGARMWRDIIAVLESVNAIMIADHGCGMDASTLESVFLQVGTPFRLGTQSSGQLNRKILGNKGIGRLAMMRLGSNATVTSWTDRSNASKIDFNWREFEDEDSQLEDVSIDIEPAEPRHDGVSGTVIDISGLQTEWTKRRVDEKFVGGFLRRLQNPFEGMSSGAPFPIDVHYNGGNRIPIERMKAVLGEHAQADLELRFAPLCGSGTDSAITTILIDHLRGLDPQQTTRTCDEVAHRVEATLDELRQIGPFIARLRWFNRDTLRKQTTLQGTTKEAKAELDVWSGGVAIYRDGFRVGFSGDSSGEDWLAIDSSALKRGGFAVNRIQTVGALEITRQNNPNLIDRSNREGLIDSRSTQLVRDILFNFAIEELRRHITHEATEEKRATLDEVAKSAPETIRTRIAQAEQGIAEIKSQLSPELRKVLKPVSDHLHYIKGETKRFEEAARQVGERREDILELAGVGTVMSGVLHELTRTTGQTRQLMRKLAKDESPKTRALLEKLDDEIKAINTRLRQLDPLTPSGRHRKEEFDLSGLLQTILHGYKARFRRHAVHPNFTISGQEGITPFSVNMVRGFVSLALENLITNSIYWLQRGLKPGSSQREINLELDPVSKTLTIWDNGPGISSADKERVFTAGFTLRPRGQGLGLFLAAEVAAHHKASLVLDGADEDGRFRTFVLQLPKD
ncbi:MAG: sensor histidine kinase [Pseudomonadota bacterium]